MDTRFPFVVIARSGNDSISLQSFIHAFGGATRANGWRRALAEKLKIDVSILPKATDA
jgi:hypothetical protein